MSRRDLLVRGADPGVGRGRADDLDPDGEAPAVGGGHQRRDPALKGARHRVGRREGGGIDPAGRPPEDVERVELPGRPAIVHRHDHAPLGTRLADVAPLDVAREDDRDVAGVHLLAGVDVAQGPVVIPLAAEGIDGAGGIAPRPFATIGAGVQQADVEATGDGARVARREVVADLLGGEALAVDRHVDRRQVQGFRLAAARAGGPLRATAARGSSCSWRRGSR